MEDRIKTADIDELNSTIIELFSLLSNNQMSNYLEKKGINILADYGIDEKELKDVIDNIDDGEYYISELQIYDNEPWCESDSEYRDSFDILPVLAQAVDYCLILFEKHQYEKFLELEKQLLSLNIDFQLFDEYDDDYCEINSYDLKDTFYFLDYNEHSKKMTTIKNMVFSIVGTQDYDYESFISMFETINFYDLNTIDEILNFVSDKDKFLNNIKALLKDDLNKNNLPSSLVPLLLDFANDEKLFKAYAYNGEPPSLKLFDMYYQYMESNNKDITSVIDSAIKIFPINIHIEKYAKIAVQLDDSNEEYKIALYNANYLNDDNFFELYKISDKNKVLEILKKNFHLALATLDFKYIDNLSVGELLKLLELLSDNYQNHGYDERTIINIKKWLNSITITDDFLKKLCDYTFEKLDIECQYILGNKIKDEYYSLANHVIRLDYYKNGIANDYYNKYNRYKCFRECLKKYKI